MMRVSTVARILRFGLLPLTVFVAFGLFASPASATTYLVRPDGNGDFVTIQAAIDSAVAGDIIELSDGVFTGDGNRDLDFLGKGITLRSQSGDPELCVIDCENAEIDRFIYEI